MQPPDRPTFRRRHRISLDRDFRAVFACKLRKSSGPLTVHARPTDGPEHRLGLSVGRRVGKAVVRVRLKRLIREAFRLSRAGIPRPTAGGQPGSYDLVVSVRPHEPMRLAQVRDRLLDAIGRVHAEQLRRRARQDQE